MAKHNCETCRFRATYDRNADSFLGKLWRWHIGWCPGWKRYMTSLPKEKRAELAETYDLEKYKQQR